MTEIEQLRQDIEKLEAAEGVFRRKYGQDYKQYNTELARMRKRLAKLEAEAAAAADPWANAKWQAKNLGNDGRPDIYNYANRLENRIAELEAELARTKEAHETVGEAYDCKREDNKDLRRTVKELQAELAKRPKVYCVRTHDGIATTGGFSKVPRVFLAESIEDEYGDGAQHIVLYTGEQS